MPVPCLADLLGEQGYSTVLFSSNADAYGDSATTNWGYEKVSAPPDPAVPAQYWDMNMDTEKYKNTSHYGYEEDIMLQDRKSTRLNSSHANISYAVFCLKKKTNTPATPPP